MKTLWIAVLLIHAVAFGQTASTPNNGAVPNNGAKPNNAPPPTPPAASPAAQEGSKPSTVPPPATPPPGTVPAAEPKLPPGITLSEPSFPLPLENRNKIRDFQVQWDQLEIDNNKLLLQIEKNKTKQGELLNGIRTIAYDFAQEHKIDINVYELDGTDIKFVKKKPPAAAATK